MLRAWRIQEGGGPIAFAVGSTGQLAKASVALLPLPFAAERQYRQADMSPREQYDNLLAAIREGRDDQVRQMLATDLDLNVSLDDDPPPLFAAILAANAPLIESLIEHGADVNVEPESPADCLYAPKPLDWAMQLRFLLDWQKYHPMVELLARRGATDLDGEAELPEIDQVRERARQYQAKRA